MRGIPSPFIKIYERGRDTPHPSLLPLMLMRKDFLDEVLVRPTLRPSDSRSRASMLRAYFECGTAYNRGVIQTREHVMPHLLKVALPFAVAAVRFYRRNMASLRE